MTTPQWKKQLAIVLTWVRDKAIVLALALLVVSLLSPRAGKAQFVNPCCATAAIGLTSINSSLVSNIGGGLTKILSVEKNMQQFEQSTIYPSSTITQALNLVNGLSGLYTQIRNIYHLFPHFSSATLGNTRALESILLSGSAGQIGNTNSAYLNVYGGVPLPNDAPVAARNVIDMSDAVAQDAMERAIAIDNIADQELKAADQINASIQNSAPGSAPIIEAQADAWLVRANAYTQSAVSDLMRERAAALANNGALLKDGANYTSVTTQGIAGGLTHH
jgi:hypothetical protein